MKHLFIILLATVCTRVYAQVPTNQSPAETNAGLVFNKHIYELEDHWVTFPKNPQTGKYAFGFIYVDMMAGFTFDVEGNFTINDEGKIIRDSIPAIKTASYKVRLGPNTKLVAALPEGILPTLKVKPVPDWLSIYHPLNQDKSSVGIKVTYGKHLNSAGAPKEALVYLESAYAVEPHAKGLEFELTYSYNELKQYDKAIGILNAAIAAAPTDAMFYRELGYAYMQKDDADEAIKTYTKGLEIPGVNAETKSEMAWNMAVVYRDKKHDTEQFKKWGQQAKDWVPADSNLGRTLKNVTF